MPIFLWLYCETFTADDVKQCLFFLSYSEVESKTSVFVHVCYGGINATQNRTNGLLVHLSNNLGM